MEGHYAHDCTYPKQNKKDIEAKGKKGAVKNLKEAGEESVKIEQLRQCLRELEMKAALNRMANLEGEDQLCLGPTVFVDVTVNRVKTAALVDTGSRATIFSLDNEMKILASQRDLSIPVKQWRERSFRHAMLPSRAMGVTVMTWCPRLYYSWPWEEDRSMPMFWFKRGFQTICCWGQTPSWDCTCHSEHQHAHPDTRGPWETPTLAAARKPLASAIPWIAWKLWTSAIPQVPGERGMSGRLWISGKLHEKGGSQISVEHWTPGRCQILNKV